MTQPEPFDATTACHPSTLYTDGTGRCQMAEPCTLRCHIRYLDDQMQPNDGWADAENAQAWQRFYAANPGAEEAMKAACSPTAREPTP